MTNLKSLWRQGQTADVHQTRYCEESDREHKKIPSRNQSTQQQNAPQDDGCQTDEVQ